MLRVWGSGFRVQSLVFGVQGSWLRDYELGICLQDVGFGVEGLELEI